MRNIENFVESNETGCVLPIRQQHNRAAAGHLLLIIEPDLPQLTQRDVDRVVHRGRAGGDGVAYRVVQCGLVVGERCKNLNPAVKVDHRCDVGRPELPDEARRSLLSNRQRLVHAGTRVDEQRQGEPHVRLAEERDVLRSPFFQHGEIAEIQIGHVPPGSIGDGHVKKDDIDASAKSDARALCSDVQP